VFDYDDIPAGYYDSRITKGPRPQRTWHQLEFRYVKKFLPSGGHLLDIGCASGTFTGTLAWPGTSVGIDPSEKQIAFAQEKYGNPPRCTFQKASLPTLPFPAETFSVATMMQVIEHLPMEILLPGLRDVRRVLKPGGTLIVTTPNYRSPWPVLERVVEMFSPFSYGEQHVVKFTKQSLHSFLTDQGLRVERVTSFMHTAWALSIVLPQIAVACGAMEQRIPFGGLLLCAVCQKAHEGNRPEVR